VHGACEIWIAFKKLKMRSQISKALWIFAHYQNLNAPRFYQFIDTVLTILKLPARNNRSLHPRDFLASLLNEPVWHEAANKTQLPTLWGPYVWQMLSDLANEKPSQDTFATLLHRLVHVLPCASCATHFRQLLEKTNLRKRSHPSELVTHLREKIASRLRSEQDQSRRSSRRSHERRRSEHVSRSRPNRRRDPNPVARFQGCACGV
jgi:hypothetical protein